MSNIIAGWFNEDGVAAVAWALTGIVQHIDCAIWPWWHACFVAERATPTWPYRVNAPAALAMYEEFTSANRG